MKVLKKGDVKLPWKCEVDCKSCNATLELCDTDVKSKAVAQTGGYGGDGYTTTEYYCVCGDCGDSIELSDKIISNWRKAGVAKKVRNTRVYKSRNYSHGWDEK